MGSNFSINIAVFHCLWASSLCLRAENIDLWAYFPWLRAKTAGLWANSLFYGRLFSVRAKAQFPKPSR